MLKKALWITLSLVLAFTAYLFAQAAASEGAGPHNPAVMVTELKPCPDSPNCVSTQATDDKRRDPIPYSGTRHETQAKLLRVLDEMPRTERQRVDGDYVHYTFKTWPIPFTDDVEFLFDDEAKVIHYRSASRVGHSDLGVNGKRMAKIVKAFTAP